VAVAAAAAAANDAGASGRAEATEGVAAPALVAVLHARERIAVTSALLQTLRRAEHVHRNLERERETKIIQQHTNILPSGI
jgi:hypothetical protein